MRSSVAPALKSRPRFSVGRMTSESMATLRRFHSPARMPGAGGSRSGKARRQGDRRTAAAGADRRRRLRRIGMVRGQRAAQEGSHRAQRLTSRHPPTGIERDAIGRQVAVLERDQDAGSSSRRRPARGRARQRRRATNTGTARRNSGPGRAGRGRASSRRGPAFPVTSPFSAVQAPSPTTVHAPRPLPAEDGVRLEIAGRPLRGHQRREKRRAEHDAGADVSLHEYRPVRGRLTPRAGLWPASCRDNRLSWASQRAQGASPPRQRRRAASFTRASRAGIRR